MDQATIKLLFIYEPETGMLRRIGGRTGYPWRGIGRNLRYLAFTYKGETIYLHQAVWLYHYGWLPTMLDHKDRNTKNCRIENLRPCTNAQNQYNGERKSNNKSGFKGVVFDPRMLKPWRARIVVNKKPVHLGWFDTAEAASDAYQTAALHHAGEFAYVGRRA